MDFDNFIKEQMATGLYKSVNNIVHGVYLGHLNCK